MDDAAPPNDNVNGTATLVGHARDSVRWVFWGRVVLQLVSLAFTFILARLLDPEAFGLYGLAFVVIHFANQVESLRVEAAMVQAADLDSRQLSAAWSFSILFGIVSFACVFALSAPIAQLFAREELTALLRVGAAVLIVRSLFMPARVLLQRTLRFKALTIVEVLRLIPSGTVAVWMAWSGYGAWSLLAYYLLREAVGGVLLLALDRSWSRPIIAWDRVRPLVRFGLSSSISEWLVFLLNNLPDLFVGKFLGASSLGVYRQGVALVNRPISYVDDVLNKVAFPLFSRAWGDPELVKRGFLRAFRVLFVVTLPILGITALLADESVAILYGSQWEAAVPVVQVLAAVGFARMLQPLNSAVFHAAGRPQVEARLNAVSLVVLISLLLVIRPADIRAVATIVALSYVFLALLGSQLSMYSIGVSWREAMRSMGVPVVAFAFCMMVGLFTRVAVLNAGLLIRTGIIALVAISTYVLVLFLIDRRTVGDLGSLLFRRVKLHEVSND